MFCTCGPCDRKGLFRGYYSLGSIDPAAARLLVQEPAWIRYKAQRYLAAAACPVGCLLDLEVWLRLAVRLFGDLGSDLPSKVELMELFRWHSEALDGSWSKEGLNEDQFSNLLSELFLRHAALVPL
ncbi:unnamed protein product [Polarella glacialis]|uniref:Uncharacterized protein n=1 Tax=Polarella glacialis TaxID=89957 RepID=A0A813DA35_POLGL|nr:unnamed protein product [Polarella glacialis]